MEKEFVSHEQAIALKELGFNESCVGYYDLDGLQITTHHWHPGNKNSEFPLPHTTNNPKVSAPTFAQAFRWFRNNHNLHGCVDLHTTTPTHWYIRIDDIKTNNYLFHSLNTDLRYDTYESAEQACLNKLIEIIKTK